MADFAEPARKREGGAEDEGTASSFRDQLQLAQFLVLSGLLLFAVFYTLYFARALLIPIVLAMVLNLLLAPAVRKLARLGVPEGLGAALILLAVLAGIGYGVVRLSAPAGYWLDQAPQSFQQIEAKLRSVSEAVEEVQETTKQVEELAETGGSRETPAVVIQGPSLTELLVAGTWQFAATVATAAILLYFMLASGELFLRKLVKVLPRLHDKKRAVEIARQTESDISTYLLTVTGANAALGLATGISMHLLGMPNPVLWGVMAALVNFVPYLGSLTTLAVLTLVALLSFDEWTRILAPPLVFLVLTTLEGQLITPMLLGRRLTLNPVVIFISLLVAGWLWGIAGVLLAVPLLAIIKILCDHIDPLNPLGEFLGRRD